MGLFLKKKVLECFANVAHSSLPPAAIALFLQFISFVFMLLLSILVGNKLPPLLSFPFFVFAHAITAAFLSFLFRMEWWWWLIQFCFPVLIVGFSFSDISPIYYLGAFIVFALLYWSVFRTQVPYYPSKSSLFPLILDLLPSEKSIKFIDIGSGMGGLLIELSTVRKNDQFYGVEIAPLPWIVSFLRAKYQMAPVHFKLGDYKEVNLREYDVVFAYLSPVAMPGLWQKVSSEMQTGSILLSYEFEIPNVQPDLCVNLNANDPILYLWRI